MGDIPKYLEVEPLRRLPEEGRELIGKEVWLFWKRDGEQTRVTMDNEHKLIIAGHNLDEATEDVVRQIGLIDGLKDKLTKLLLQWDDLVLYGELVRAGNGPTKIEAIRPKASWVLFDARHTFLNDLFMQHGNLIRMAQLYGLETAPLYKMFTPHTMEELLTELEQAKVWCRMNRIEGVVGKSFSENGEMIVFKSKIERSEIPKELFTEEELRPKRKEPEGPQLPPMPEEKVLRALQHAWDQFVETIGDKAPELVEQYWKGRRAIAIPLIVKQLKLEADEHGFSVPRNAYQLYLETSIEKLRGDKV